MERVTADTILDCASLSKSFAAAAVALLVEDKEENPGMKWGQPVSKYLSHDIVLED